MLKQLRQQIVQNLWNAYYLSSPDMQRMDSALKQKGMTNYALDHFAVVDLTGPYSGIPQLGQIFSGMGYVERGKDYLAEKQNDFLWMAETDCELLNAGDALPQVVIADFRLDEMPTEIRNIIYHYSSQTSHTAVAEINNLLDQVTAGVSEALIPCMHKCIHYFSGHDWPKPCVKEFHMVREFNELLAWVLVFGRKPNHFTLSIHLMQDFNNFAEFHQFIEQEVKLALNQEGGIIKGGPESGIAQSSTMGITQKIKLMDGEIEIPTGFVEFAWRYSDSPAHAGRWKDYFTGFVASNANRVVESLYVSE